MIAVDEDALSCDLAETYGIFNWRALPIEQIAVLAIGLREDSRIKMAIEKSRIPLSITLQAAILDHLRLLIWRDSADAAHGGSCPDSVLEMLTGAEPQRDTLGFDSPQAFEAYRAKILGEVT